MLFTDQDIKLLQSLANTDDKKQMILRLVVTAMMQGTTITAPEMTRVTQIIMNTLNHTDANTSKTSKNNSAV